MSSRAPRRATSSSTSTRSRSPVNRASISARSRSVGDTRLDTGVGPPSSACEASKGTYVRRHLHRYWDTTGPSPLINSVHRRLRRRGERRYVLSAGATFFPLIIVGLAVVLYLSQRTDHPGWDESCLAWERRGRCKVVARVQEGRGEAPATLLAPGRYRDLTQGHLRDQVDQVGEGLFEGGGEAVAGEGVPADTYAGEHDGRGGAVEGFGQVGQVLWAEVVGPGGWGGRGRVDPAEQDRAWRGLGGGVDQDDQ